MMYDSLELFDLYEYKIFLHTEYRSSANFCILTGYSRWGISNSLHVISMAMELIGMPKDISIHQFGKLDWYPSGSVFVGNGISRNDMPFSYHADW